MIKLRFNQSERWTRNFADYVDKDYADDIPFEEWVAYEENRPLRAANLAMAFNGRLMGEATIFGDIDKMWLEFDKDSDATIFVLRWS